MWAIAGGTLATARQAQIARRERARAQGRFDDVRQLANSFMFEVHDAIQNLPGSTPARRLLITRVLEYLEKLNRDATLESPLLLEIATAYQKVGNVQGNPFFANIGDAAGAMQSYRKALAIAQGLVDRDPSEPNRTALATGHHLLADMFWGQGSFPEALEHYRTAATLRADLLAADADSEQRRLDLALSHYGIGQTLLRSGDYPDAVEAFTRSQTIQAEAMQRNPSSVVARRSFATSLSKLGDVLAIQGDHRGALGFHAKAATILRDVLALDPANALIKRTLALLLFRVSNDQNNTGDFRSTLATGREGLDLLTPIVESDPTNVQALMDTASTRRVLADALIGLKRPRDALSELDTAERALRKTQAVTPGYAENSTELSMTLIARADLLAQLGDRPAAIQAYGDAAMFLERNASRVESARYRSIAHERAGDLERQLARSAGAAAAADHRRDACRHYQRGLDALARPGQTDDPREVKERQVLSEKLAECR